MTTGVNLALKGGWGPVALIRLLSQINHLANLDSGQLSKLLVRDITSRVFDNFHSLNLAAELTVNHREGLPLPGCSVNLSALISTTLSLLRIIPCLMTLSS